MEARLRQAGNSKRTFGRDITNLERRNKAQSICEKASSLVEHRKTSRSFEKKTPQEIKDSITEYEEEILRFMLSLQVYLSLFSKKRRKNWWSASLPICATSWSTGLLMSINLLISRSKHSTLLWPTSTNTQQSTRSQSMNTSWLELPVSG